MNDPAANMNATSMPGRGCFLGFAAGSSRYRGLLVADALTPRAPISPHATPVAARAVAIVVAVVGARTIIIRARQRAADNGAGCQSPDHGARNPAATRLGIGWNRNRGDGNSCSGSDRGKCLRRSHRIPPFLISQSDQRGSRRKVPLTDSRRRAVREVLATAAAAGAEAGAAARPYRRTAAARCPDPPPATRVSSPTRQPPARLLRARRCPE